MRVLITTRQAYGHLYPMLPIARAAQHAGHEVVIATGPDLAPHVEQLGFPAWSVGRSGAEDFAAFRATQPDMATLSLGDRLPDAFHALPRRDTVYLTLGTVFHQAPGVFEAALAGLRELPVNVVVTTGPDADPARVGPQPPNVVIEPYIPQALLLSQCRVVVSHGGSGTMFGALSHGLPQLFLPLGADQFWNAAAGQRVGAALILPPEALSAQAVASSVQRLITEPTFTAAARRIQTEITTMPTAADVLPEILPL